MKKIIFIALLIVLAFSAYSQSTGRWNCYEPLIGDVNGDGKDDVIWNETTNRNKTYVGISSGNGTFSFSTKQSHPQIGWDPYKTLIGDVNGDGKDDIIWNETIGRNRIYVGISNGNGTFSFSQRQDHPLSGWGNYETLIGDVNGDGKDDIIWNETRGRNRIYVGISNGNGTFSFSERQDHPLSGWDTYKILIGDVNGDGKDDIIWNETNSRNRVYVGISNGNGTFSFSERQDHPLSGWRTYKTLIGDVNGDGKDDIIWNETIGRNRTYIGTSNGNGTFSFSARQDHPQSGWYAYETLVGDTNGDGKADVIWNEPEKYHTTYSGKRYNTVYVGLRAGNSFIFKPKQQSY